MNSEDLDLLLACKRRLESPGFVARAGHFIGRPLESAVDRLPQSWRQRVGELTHKALQKSLDVAMSTLDPHAAPTRPQLRLHKVAAGFSGALGGAFGLAALAVELPVSTTIMLRAIADIARANGEDLSQFEARMACLQVFALGGVSTRDDDAESGYFAVRAALAAAIGEAAGQTARGGLVRESSPALVRLMSLIAARYQVQVSRKAAVQAIPLLGAASGAAINLAFTRHFQNVAAAHFGLRRLERKYGSDLVREAWRSAPV